MLEDRSLKLDLCALFLLALTMFLTVALATYDPADPVAEIARPLSGIYQPDVLVYPSYDKVHNACGLWGALIADLLLNTFGIGSYYLLISLAALDAILLRRQNVRGPLVRIAGWFISLAAIVTLASMLIPQLSPGPVVGAGGYLGLLGRHVLQQHFALPGACILCISIMLGGLLLCTDYVLLRWTFIATSQGTRLARKGLSHARPRTAAATAAPAAATAKTKTVPAAEAESDDGEEEPSIRIRGKSITRSADVDDDAELDDDEHAAEDEQEFNSEEDESADDYDAEIEDDEEDDEQAEENEEVDEEDEHTVRSTNGGKLVRGDAPHDGGPRVRKRNTKDEHDLVRSHLDEAAIAADVAEFELPSIDLLIPGDDICFDEQEKEVRRKAKILERTFADFGFQVKVVEIETGPVIAQYEVQLEAGLRLSKITGLADDLAIALRVPSVRIVAPIPGKNTVGIEVPNSVRQVVRLREVLQESQPKLAKMRIPLFLGKDVSGNPLTVDLSTLPHLLIAGRTGTGKSVCLNAIISSILMTKRPDEVRMLMIDPKMVELSGYGRLPHLMHPVVTDMRKAEAILAWAVDKMEERYALLARAGVRHISSFNQLSEEELMERLQPESEEERKQIPLNLPFIVIVADEMADLMMTAGKEVEQHIIRLAQKSRAVGIHLILATQKPTVDVITGLIKSNLPARIAFQVASRTDSRVVLDEMGADKLLGNGDMLFLWPGTSTLLRGQGTYLSDDEIERIVDAVSTGEQNFVHELVNIKVDQPTGEEPGVLKKRDEMYEQAVDVVVREGRGSVSLLQRALGIGYGRAARLIDFMAEDGIVGTYAGSQAREVLISIADWERMQGSGQGGQPTAAPPPPTPPAPPRRSNKIRPPADGWDGDKPRTEPAPPRRAPIALLSAEDNEQGESDEQQQPWTTTATAVKAKRPSRRLLDAEPENEDQDDEEIDEPLEVDEDGDELSGEEEGEYSSGCSAIEEDSVEDEEVDDEYQYEDEYEEEEEEEEEGEEEEDGDEDEEYDDEDDLDDEQEELDELAEEEEEEAAEGDDSARRSDAPAAQAGEDGWIDLPDEEFADAEPWEVPASRGRKGQKRSPEAGRTARDDGDKQRPPAKRPAARRKRGDNVAESA